MEVNTLSIIMFVLVPILTAVLGGWVGAFFGNKYRKDKETQDGKGQAAAQGKRRQRGAGSRALRLSGRLRLYAQIQAVRLGKPPAVPRRRQGRKIKARRVWRKRIQIWTDSRSGMASSC